MLNKLSVYTFGNCLSSSMAIILGFSIFWLYEKPSISLLLLTTKIFASIIFCNVTVISLYLTDLAVAFCTIYLILRVLSNSSMLILHLILSLNFIKYIVLYLYF